MSIHESKEDDKANQAILERSQKHSVAHFLGQKDVSEFLLGVETITAINGED